ncbi:unnamed protein product, partial [Musa textilis]
DSISTIQSPPYLYDFYKHCIIFFIAFANMCRILWWVICPCIETLTTKNTCVVLSINKCTEVTFRAERWNANKRQEHDKISPA